MLQTIRKCSFADQPIPIADRNLLSRYAVCDGEGRMSPELRQTALAAIRGQQPALALGDPFVESEDRAVAEFALSVIQLGTFSPRKMRALLDSDYPYDKFKSLKESPSKPRNLGPSLN